jgi:hypothetical protein
MQPKTVPVGKAAICKACEVVWLDKPAVSSLPVTATTPSDQPTLETQSFHCQQCGAPVLHSWDERCQYCGAALHAPTQVVVLENDLPDDGRATTRSHGTSRLAHALAMMMTPID